MNHNMSFSKTGKCAVCGEDTSLLIHTPCGEKMDKLRKKKGKKRKYSKEYLYRLAHIDG